MTYVSCYYHAFSGQQKVQSAHNFGRNSLCQSAFSSMRAPMLSSKIDFFEKSILGISFKKSFRQKCFPKTLFVELGTPTSNISRLSFIVFSHLSNRLSFLLCFSSNSLLKNQNLNLVQSDLVEVAKPDERSIMTYVAAFYHAFAGDQKVPSFLSISLFFAHFQNRPTQKISCKLVF